MLENESLPGKENTGIVMMIMIDSGLISIGSKCLNRCKMVGVTCNDLFL